jgi:starch phosphorylase
VRWSWNHNHATDQVWRRLDLELWETTQNPWFVLQTVSREQIEQAWAGPVFPIPLEESRIVWQR